MRWRAVLACALALAALPFGARAAITCSITSPGFATAYSSTAPGPFNITQTFFTVTCTRGATGDPTSVNYSVKVNNGSNAQGQKNRAANGTSRILYELYKDSGCGTVWQGNTAITGTISFSGTGTVSQQGDYWGCVPGAQTGLAAGTYTDSVAMTMTYGTPQSTAPGSISVVINTPPTCSITTAPGTVALTYASFGVTANASTTFGVTCTLALPYTLALDATSGTLLGLNYTLALSAASSTGTGAPQTFSINGAIAAGQSGNCATSSCVGVQARSVTVSY
jgi:spore coat protein U-like protein